MATLPISYSRSTIKLEKLCRLCLSKDTVLQSIFDVHFGVTSLDYVITTLTGVKIDERDGLPTSVCNSCTDKASIAYDLKKLVLESQAFLQDIVKKEKSEKLDYNNVLQNEILKVKEEQACTYDDFDGDYAEMSLDDFNDADHIKVEIEAIGKSMGPTSHLECHICLKQLESDLALITHLKSCSTAPEDVVVESGSYCPLCGTCYNSCANLTKHMWDKHAELMGPKKRGRPRNIKTSTIMNRLSGNGVCIKPVLLEKECYIHECSICKKLFKNNDELKEHIASHKDTKLYSCLVCKKMYLRLSKFKAHPCFQSHSGDDSTAMKEYDKKTFLKEDTFRSVLDNVAMPQVCHLCSEVFDFTVEMSSHIDSQHPEASKRCNICTKLFSSVKSAVRHRKSCKKIEKKYKCNTCGLKFPFEISLNKHILRHHEGESVSTNFIDPVLKEAAKTFQCDTCKKLFARKVTLAVHTRLHMITKTFQCDVCHREFNRKDNMKQHRRTHEQRAPKPHTSLCLYCGRSFNNSSNLIVHMRRHTGEKPYKCDFCAKGFPRSSDLVMHRRSHTGEKPCQCKICGKAFSRSNKLTRHMRVHTGHKPYKCTYCEKAFAQSNDLTLHIRRHTGDKPYICEVCGDRFIQGTALQTHRRAHGHFPATAPPPSIFDPGLMQPSKNNASILRLPMGGPPPMYPLSHSGL